LIYGTPGTSVRRTQVDTFQLTTDLVPRGDQGEAIDGIVRAYEGGARRVTLLGVTGSGKTFTMANVIQRLQRPTLVVSHNKTLAAQLYNELREFFPRNAVEYFVSYYDYYQPEAYVPQTDTYIAKEVDISEELDKLRHRATAALLSRKDVVIVASVSCIYGLGVPEYYREMTILLTEGTTITRQGLLKELVRLQYERNDVALDRGRFRARGDVVEVWPPGMDTIVRVELFGDRVERISEVDRVTGQAIERWSSAMIPPAKHYVIEEELLKRALGEVKEELEQRARAFEDEGKPLEAERIRQRTGFDLELLEATGFCSGIENYSRYFTRRAPGEPPYTLLDFFPEGFLTIIDESHVTLPQLHGMHNGDRSRKRTLVDYGFRLPSAYDNRPLMYEEFEQRTGPTLYVSATPDEYELLHSDHVAEQVVRPTGLLDPRLEVRPVKGQVDDLLGEIRVRVARGERVLVTTLTKRMAEDLTDHYAELGVRVRYLHSDIETVERVELLRDLEAGEFDVLVGINLLREGLDLPQVSLVAIFDADKQGFLRSETSLLQTIGRASRNLNGTVIMYADRVTEAMRRVLDITETRRAKQAAYNAEHGITPTTIVKARPIRPIGVRRAKELPVSAEDIEVDLKAGPEAVIDQLRREMDRAAADLEFEYAAALRDKIAEIEESELGIEGSAEAAAAVASRRAVTGRRRKGAGRPGAGGGRGGGRGGGAWRRGRGRGGA
jgi:excinuclease ABC subunit B